MLLARALLLAGTLLCLRLTGAAAQPAPVSEAIIINEILYAPSPSQNEFIELYNRSETPFDLRTLSFSDNREEPQSIVETSVLLPPDGYVVLVRDEALFASAFPEVPFIAPSGWDALNNSGDAVVLYQGDIVVDRVPYDPDWGGADGRSLERVDPAGPSDRSTNFGSSTAQAGATPGRQNSIFAPDIAPPTAMFAGVKAPDTVEVVFDEALAVRSTVHFSLDDGSQPIARRRAEGGNRVDLVFGAPVAGLRLRIEGARDLVGNALRDTSVYLGYAPDDGELALTEVMYDPQADDFDHRPNQPEYFEFTNRAPHAISLRGLFWTDVPDETDTADTTRIGHHVLKVLPPGGWAVAYAEPEPVDSPITEGRLAVSFPATDFSASSTILLPIDAAALGLRNGGDRIRLHRADGRPIAELTYDPDWHAPSLVDARGTSLERISFTAPAHASSNWTSSVAVDGGTPGRPNSVRLAPDTPTDRRLTVAPSPFSPDGDGLDDVARIQFRLDTNTAAVRVRIFDAAGRLVRTLEESRLVGRTGELLWDGRGDTGRTLRIGIYIVLFEALDAAGGRTVTMKCPVVLARTLD